MFGTTVYFIRASLLVSKGQMAREAGVNILNHIFGLVLLLHSLDPEPPQELKSGLDSTKLGLKVCHLYCQLNCFHKAGLVVQNWIDMSITWSCSWTARIQKRMRREIIKRSMIVNKPELFSETKGASIRTNAEGLCSQTSCLLAS